LSTVYSLTNSKKTTKLQIYDKSQTTTLKNENKKISTQRFFFGFINVVSQFDNT